MTTLKEPIVLARIPNGATSCLTRRRHTFPHLSDKVIYLVSVFVLVLFSGVLVTGAPSGRGQVPQGGKNPSTPTSTCPEDDVGVKTYLAGTVFEGKARSRSLVKDGAYNVTFVVQQVLKGSEPNLSVRSLVRLQFAERFAGSRKADVVCQQDIPVRPAVVRASIKRGVKYLVFADRIGPHLFRPRGEPVKRNKKNMGGVRSVLCHNCVRPPTLVGLRDVSLESMQRLRLVCKARTGSPVPSLHWYKDGVRVAPDSKYRLQFKKKRSILVIQRIKSEDAGVYECRALSVTGDRATMSARVTVKHDTRTDNTTLWPHVGSACPVEGYCLNEGNCTFYETLAELVCSCAEGFKGRRCENKDVRGNLRKDSWAIDPRTRKLGHY